IFVHKFYCRYGWTRLCHSLYLGCSVFILLYYLKSDKTGIESLVVGILENSDRHQPLYQCEAAPTF
ncbi:MAG TPA: hypothetical protein V6D04_09695, partial [Candidatus Obscuribacterales bacterium]